jgi:hypothetical protein
MWRGLFDLHARMSGPVVASDPRFTHLDGEAERHFLNEAQLWWVTPEMSALVRHAADSLPATTLTEDLIPKHKTVLAFLVEPLIGNDAAIEGNTMRVQILMWYHARLIWAPGADFITTSMYACTPEFPDVPYMPVGRTDWRYGTDTEVPTFNPGNADADDNRLEAMAQDRRWLAALVLLAAQPLAEHSTVSLTNKSKLRAYRKKSNLPHNVRLVDVRRTIREATDGEGGKVDWSHRWMVGAETGGFWKQVAYGPERSLRRPQWIMPFIKGPKDKPLILKDTVHVVRGDQPD